MSRSLARDPHRRSWLKLWTACLLIWLPVSAGGIYIKHYILTTWEFGRIAAGMLPPGHDFSVLQRFSFFRADLLFALVAAPLALALIVRPFPARWRLWIAGGAAAPALLVLAAQFQGYRQVGRFLPLDLFIDAVQWGIDNPDKIRPYLSLDKAPGLLGLELAAGGLLVAVAARAGWRRTRAYRQDPALRARVAVAGKWLWIGLLFPTAVAWLPWMPATPYHAATVWMAGSSLLDADKMQAAGYLAMPLDGLRAHYRQAASAPPPRTPPLYWGAARDYDVLLFVFETGPARCVATDGDLEALPNMRRLREHSWVGARHHSTYPATPRAMFSMLSSMYPSTGGRLFRDVPRPIPGLMNILKAAGYETGVYMPSFLSRERQLYTMLGMRQVSIADSGLYRAGHDQQTWWSAARRDLAALGTLESEIAGFAARNQRFAAVYLPEVGHGPWIDVVGGGGERDWVKRGRNVMILQDQWLGELIATLEKHKRLERTLIVVTADHGVRNTEEDPSFPAGRIDDYTFHVPLLIYAPGVRPSRADIPWLTSHIDVTPSLLDLLGISAGREYEEGSPVWDERLKDRAIFFDAKDSLGADGYYAGGKFWMWNSVIDVAYRAEGMHFEDRDAIPPGDPARRRARDFIQDHAALQYAWYNRALH
jgi:hypothetical protein